MGRIGRVLQVGPRLLPTALVFRALGLGALTVSALNLGGLSVGVPGVLCFNFFGIAGVLRPSVEPCRDLKSQPGAERAATTSPGWLDAPDRYSQRKRPSVPGGPAAAAAGWTAGASPQPCALELAFESGVAQAGADMPLTAILRSGDLDQLTTHARLAVGRPAVTVPEDLAGSSRYRPPPRRPASRTAALPARNGPPASKTPSGTRAHKVSPVHDDPRRESSSSHVSIVRVRSGRLCQPTTDPSRTARRCGG